MNDQSNASNRYGNAPQTESPRPVQNDMAELASTIGDLESAVRALCGRISSLVPSGDPYSRVEKAGQGVQSVPRPVRSHFGDELQNRIHELRGITASINEVVKGIEL